MGTGGADERKKNKNKNKTGTHRKTWQTCFGRLPSERRRHQFYNVMQHLMLPVVALVALFWVALAGLIWHLQRGNTTDNYWITVAFYFPQVWLYWFFQTVLLQFNPSRRMVRYLTCGDTVKWLHVITGGLMNIGRWTEERDHIIAVVRQKVAERGVDGFAASFASTSKLAELLGPAEEEEAKAAAAAAAAAGGGEAARATVVQPESESPPPPQPPPEASSSSDNDLPAMFQLEDSGGDLPMF